MLDNNKHRFHLSPDDHRHLEQLRAERPARSAREPGLTTGETIADFIAGTVGSWRFIVLQTVVLVVWIALNLAAAVYNWDPYPFILLNLVLSFQAAYAAPIIMMSQNRQSQIDRKRAEHDYRINIKAELEIELLHNKIDALREQEVLKLLNIIQRLATHLAPDLVTATEADATGQGSSAT